MLSSLISYLKILVFIFNNFSKNYDDFYPYLFFIKVQYLIIPKISNDATDLWLDLEAKNLNFYLKISHIIFCLVTVSTVKFI